MFVHNLLTARDEQIFVKEASKSCLLLRTADETESQRVRIMRMGFCSPPLKILANVTKLRLVADSVQVPPRIAGLCAPDGDEAGETDEDEEPAHCQEHGREDDDSVLAIDQSFVAVLFGVCGQSGEVRQQDQAPGTEDQSLCNGQEGGKVLHQVNDEPLHSPDTTTVDEGPVQTVPEELKRSRKLFYAQACSSFPLTLQFLRK